MSKNIVVLSDGTGQEGGKGHDTNIYKLFRMLEDRTEDQIVFYDRGIGTDWRKITGNIAGAGFNQNVLQCYKFIYDNYNSGDKIFLFGFSRGAATVRSLASFINYFGILPKSRPELIKQAFKLYRMGHEATAKTPAKPAPTGDAAQNTQADDSEDAKNWMQQGVQSLVDLGNKTKEGLQQVIRGEPLNKKSEKFVHEHPNQWVSIEFLGVFDTVPALGFPGALIDTFVNLVPGWKHRFHDFALHPSVSHAYHALSIDDDRKWFHPTIWQSYKSYQTVEQVWFSGAHTDVGGGFVQPGLSDIALEWMVQKAVKHGIRLYLRSIKYWNFCIAPDASDELHPPRNGFGKVYPKKQRTWPKGAQDKKPTIHQSVLDRVDVLGKEVYDPWILKEFPDHHVEPWGETFPYDEDEKFFIRDYDEKSWKEKFEIDKKGTIDVRYPPELVTNLIARGKWSDNRLQRDLDRWKVREQRKPPTPLKKG